jgi:hypothetical protein
VWQARKCRRTLLPQSAGISEAYGVVILAICTYMYNNLFGMPCNESGDFEPHAADFFYVNLLFILQQVTGKLRMIGVYYQTFTWRAKNYNIL